jgi:hypothetical protein
MGNDPFQVTEEEAEASSKTPVVKSQLTERDTFFSCQVSDFCGVVRQFLQKKTATRDIVSKSLLVKFGSQEITLLSTDGVSYMRATIPAQVNNMMGSLVFDMESAYTVAKNQHKQVFFVVDKGNLYVDFFEGRIFIPQYGLKENIFQVNNQTVSVEQPIDPAVYLQAIDIAKPILSSSDVPELGFLFLGRDGMYVTNSIVVLKKPTPYYPCVLRGRDLISIQAVLSSEGNITLRESQDFLCWHSDTLDYWVPKISVSLSDMYRAAPEPSPSYYVVDSMFLSGVLTILNEMPDNSGTIELQFSPTLLKGRSLTKRGEESTFTVSDSPMESPRQESITLSIKILHTAMKCFPNGVVNIGIHNNKTLMFDQEKFLAIVMRV